MIAILERLGFELEEATEEEEPTWDVLVPYWRDGDVQREADVIEEVARVHGLDNFPASLPERPLAVGRLTHAQRTRRRLEDALRDRGLTETISWSFTSPAAMDALRLGDLPLLRLDNPLSEDQSVMRPLLLPGLLDAARHNAARGRPGVALFESAHVYRTSGVLPSGGTIPERGELPTYERHHLAALITQRAPAGWRSPELPADYFSLKAVLEAVLEIAGVGCLAEPDTRPFLHPGRAATVLAGEAERTLGWIGELHPLVARAWDLEAAVAFEIDVQKLAELSEGVRGYDPLSTFPAVIQDIAVVVPEDVTASDVEYAVREGGGRAAGAPVAVRRLSRRAGGRGQQVAGAAPGLPRARPHAHRRGGGRVPRRRGARAGRDRGQAPCLSPRGSPCAARPASRARSAPRSCSAIPGSS